MTKPLFVHGSSLPWYLDCPRRWAAGRMRKEITTAGFELRDRVSSIGAAVGTAHHRGGEVMLQEKRDLGKLPPLNVATDAARDTLKEEMALGIQFDYRVTPTAEAAYAQAIRMTSAYYHHVAPRIEPVHIEERFEAELPWTREPIVATCKPDVVCAESTKLDDTKTGVRIGNYNAQVGIYSMVLRSNDIPIEHASIDYVQRTSLRRPQAMPIEVKLALDVCEPDAANILRQIDLALSTWRHGDPVAGLEPGSPAAFPANPQSFLCNARWCPAHSTGKHGWCRSWLKNVS